jgi:DNA invertase Pin-like site-specific DNA recombinase
MLPVFAELERDISRERVNAGIDQSSAKERKTACAADDSRQAPAGMKQLRKDGLSKIAPAGQRRLRVVTGLLSASS